ncbi:MAG TPA: response regulator [Segeticoccus sp.]|uniref:response regulator n=1 Tax=Segeticoccus sp. TaxID=2706531 RepID=UPI002D7E7F6E|nr:response regulator [Segeticoccus sp.]HET8599537.1 response regulator [Segeticoccus sp.]
MERGHAAHSALQPTARILICDDMESIRSLLRLNLELEGYEVTEATTGREALDILCGRQAPPDLVTLDALMPDVDGWEAVRTIRSTPRLADLPIVMITASVQNADRERAVRAGVDAFVAKPFDPQRLLEIIGQLIAVRRSGGARGTTLESSE